MVRLLLEEELRTGHLNIEIKQLRGGGALNLLHIGCNIADDGQQRWVYGFQATSGGSHKTVDRLRKGISFLLLTPDGRMSRSSKAATATYSDQEVRVRPMEVLDPQHIRQRFLPDVQLVQALSKMRLHAHCLQYQHAHSDNPLLCGLVLRTHGVVEYEHYEVMRAIGLDDEGPEALIDL